MNKPFPAGVNPWYKTGNVANTRGVEANVYSVAYRTKLNVNAYPGKSRGLHFNRANKALIQAMDDPVYSVKMEKTIPGITDFLKSGKNGGIPYNSPTTLGWTWHHNVETGIMELVPYGQHTSQVLQPIFHPNGVGGFSIWGK